MVAVIVVETSKTQLSPRLRDSLSRFGHDLRTVQSLYPQLLGAATICVVVRVTLVSIVPESFLFDMLAVRQLKSYLVNVDERYEAAVDFACFPCDLDPEQAAADLAGRGSSVFGFSTYVWNGRQVLELCAALRRRLPGAKLIHGGPQATFAADEIAASNLADVIVKGDGEDVFRRILERLPGPVSTLEDIPNLILVDEHGHVHQTAVDHYFDVSQADYLLDVHDHEAEEIFYEASRGCPFTCAYCTWDITGDHRFRYYPAAKVETDLRRIFALPRLRSVSFCDSNLFLKKAHGLALIRCVNKLNEERQSSGLAPLTVCYEVNPEYLDADIIGEMQLHPDTPDSITCGLQTIHERVSRIARRSYRMKRYVANLGTLLERTGDRVSVELIYGLPGDSYEGFLESLDFLVSTCNVARVQCYPLLVLPGSHFHAHAAEFGLVHDEEPPYRLLHSDDWTAQEMEQCRRLVVFLYGVMHVFGALDATIRRRAPGRRLAAIRSLLEHFEERWPKIIEPLFERTRGRDPFDGIAVLERVLAAEADLCARVVTDSTRYLREWIERNPDSTAPTAGPLDQDRRLELWPG